MIQNSSRQTEMVVKDGAVLNVNELMKVLPHRYPFLMIDKVIHIEGAKITAIKNVTINEPYFQGHFPGHPVMPGVLQLEAMAQTAGVLTLKKPENLGKIAYLAGAENVKFRQPVIPGDVLTIEMEIIRDRQRICKAQGYCRVNGNLASEALVTFALITD